MTDLKELFQNYDHSRLLEIKNNGELFRMIRGLELCFECPQNNAHHQYNAGDHILESVRIAMEMRYDPVVCMTMLLHDIGKPVVRKTDENGTDHFYGHALSSVDIARDILDDIDRFSAEEKAEILLLIRDHDRFNSDVRNKTLRKYIREYGTKHCRHLGDVRYCDLMAQSEFERADKLKKLNEFRELLEL